MISIISDTYLAVCDIFFGHFALNFDQILSLLSRRSDKIGQERAKMRFCRFVAFDNSASLVTLHSAGRVMNGMIC